VSRDGNRLRLQEVGRPAFTVTAESPDAFSGSRDGLFIFLRDAQAQVDRLLLDEPGSGARLAPRLDAARAKAAEQAFARHIAVAPDRFRDQTPTPGSKDAVLRGIADLQRGTPNYERMSEALAAKVRSESSRLQSIAKELGAVES